MTSTLRVDTIQNSSGASEVKIDAIKDTGGNTIISSDGSGTFTSNLPSTASANDNYFLAFRSGGNLSPSANTWTAFVHNDTHVNHNTVYSTSTGEFTVPSGGAGRYFFNSQFWASQIDDGESAEIGIWDDISGSFAQVEARTRSSFGFGTGTDKGFACNVSSIIDLSVGDKVKTYIKVTSGGVFANYGYNYFLGFKLA